MFAILEGTYQVRNDGVFVGPRVGSVFLNRTSWSELEVHLIFFPWIAQINAWFLICEPPQLLSPMVGRLNTLIFCHMLAVRVKQSLKIDSVSLWNRPIFHPMFSIKKKNNFPSNQKVHQFSTFNNKQQRIWNLAPLQLSPTFPTVRLLPVLSGFDMASWRLQIPKCPVASWCCCRSRSVMKPGLQRRVATSKTGAWMLRDI